MRKVMSVLATVTLAGCVVSSESHRDPIPTTQPKPLELKVQWADVGVVNYFEEMETGTNILAEDLPAFANEVGPGRGVIVYSSDFKSVMTAKRILLEAGFKNVIIGPAARE